MLVPNPCEVTRPLIGDRDADETSELSDYSNSAFDELLELCKCLEFSVYVFFFVALFKFWNRSDWNFFSFWTPADFESEPTKLLDDVDANSTDGRMTFESPSSDEDNPLNWDPVVEACNKHVALSQVDSGNKYYTYVVCFYDSLFDSETVFHFCRTRIYGSSTRFRQFARSQRETGAQAQVIVITRTSTCLSVAARAQRWRSDRPPYKIFQNWYFRYLLLY